MSLFCNRMLVFLRYQLKKIWWKPIGFKFIKITQSYCLALRHNSTQFIDQHNSLAFDVPRIAPSVCYSYITLNTFKLSTESLIV